MAVRSAEKTFMPAGTYEGVYVNTDFKGWKLKSKTAAKATFAERCICILHR